MTLFLFLLFLLISAIVYPVAAVLFFAIVLILALILFIFDGIEWLADKIADIFKE